MMIIRMVFLSFAIVIIRSTNNPVRGFTMVSTRNINSMTISTSKQQSILHSKKYHHPRTSLQVWSMLSRTDTMPSFSLKRQRRRYEQQQYQSTMTIHFSTTNCMVPIVNRYTNLISSSSSSTCLSSTSQETEVNLINDQNTTKKRIVFLGTPDVAATTLQSLYEASIQPNSNYEIVAVVTQPPKRRQRKGSSLELTPVAQITENFNNITNNNNIQLLYPEKLSKDDNFINIMENIIKPDLCITAAYGQYLSKKFLLIPKYGTINIHPSLLPKYRGASPVQRSIEVGETIVGVSVLYTVQKMDAGPIIIQKEIPINTDTDTTTNVLPMLFQVGTNLLIDYVLPNIFNDTITMTNQNVIQQNELEVSYATMIDSSEAEFKVWKESATTCHNRLRGFSIWPQAYMYFVICNKDDESTISEPIKVKILKTRVVANSTDNNNNNNNNVINTHVTLGPTKNDGLYVTCYDGSILELLIVQPATKKAFNARDFQNGYPNQIIRYWINNNNETTDTETTS